MSAQPSVDLSGPRWSSAVRCPRKAVYDAQDAPKSAPSEQMRRWWRRGKAIEAAIRGEIFADLRAEGRRPRAEEVVAWPAADPIGEGHIDAYVPSEGLAIEIKSNGKAALTEEAALQLAGYVVNHPRAERGMVISVDSNSFEEHHYPIDAAGLEPRVREIEALVVEGVRGGQLPDRVCRTPYDGPAMFCQFVDHCFEGWHRPEPDVALLDEEAVTLAELEDDVAQARQRVRSAEAARDEQRATLRPYLEAGEAVETASVSLRVSSVAGRESLSLSDMRKAGVAVPAHLEPFVKRGEPSERWLVKRLA